MNVFATVKTSINTREAAERYGVEVNRHGKALCLFHNDRHPSLFGVCPGIDRNMHQGEGYEICRAIHAEENALLNCSRQQTMGADLYLVGVNPKDNSIHEARPCPLCARAIIQAGIRNVYLRVGEGAGNYIVVPAKELVWVQQPKD